MTVTILLTAAGAYFCGSIPFGLLIGKAKGIDIREHGSGNIGATNVTRVIGKWWGKLCFFLDFFKGCLPVLVLVVLTKHCGCLKDEYGIFPCMAALAAVCGHIYPVWIKFKGGKGVSTAAGAILALCPFALLTGLAAWGIIFFASRYVSLASILAAVILPVAAWVYNLTGFGPKASATELGLLILLAVLTIVKHTSNIKRLCNGTENRFEKKPKEETKA